MKEHIIWFLIGFIPGGFIGAYLADKFLFGKEYRKTIENLREDNKELEQRLLKKRTDEASKREADVDKKFEATELAKKLGYLVEHEGEEAITEEDDLEAIDFDGDFDLEPPDEEAEGDVRLITSEEFAKEVMQRDSESLTYYQVDGILVDGVNDVISNQTDILGMQAIEIIDTTDEDMLYLSNDIEDKVYEVMVDHNQSFYRDVLGEY